MFDDARFYTKMLQCLDCSSRTTLRYTNNKFSLTMNKSNISKVVLKRLLMKYDQLHIDIAYFEKCANSGKIP